MRLEEKQRQERTAAEAAGKPWQPIWFELVRHITMHCDLPACECPSNGSSHCCSTGLGALPLVASPLHSGLVHHLLRAPPDLTLPESKHPRMPPSRGPCCLTHDVYDTALHI